MPRESGKKMQELLRVLFLEGGAHTRASLANRMGLSEASLDVAMREARDLYRHTLEEILEDERKKYKITRFRYGHFRRCRNFLAQLYRTRKVREQEKKRMLTIIRAVAEAPQTREMLRTRLDSMDGQEDCCCDEKSLRSYLQQMEEAGILICIRDGTVTKYDLQASLFRPENSANLLSLDELVDLHDYVEYSAAVSVLSVPGHMLLDTLKQYLACVEGIEPKDIFSFKYNLIGRVLDEYLVVDLLAAIEQRRVIRLQYLYRNAENRYEAAQTPRFAKKSSNKKVFQLVPVHVVFDHQYGRWYLIGFDIETRKKATLRIENIQEILDTGQAVDIAVMSALIEQADAELALSWVVQDPGKRVTIRLKFWFFADNMTRNFLRDRVLREACWGRITQDEGSTFIFEIDVNGYLEIKPWIRSFGSSVEVLEPEELRREIIEEWAEIGAWYETV